MSMQIQWYPGHMTRAIRAMREDIALIDLIIELVDARVPLSGRNPDIDRLGNGKARLLLFSKSDLADAEENRNWEAYYREKGLTAVFLDTRKNTGLHTIKNAVEEACAAKRERDRKRGIKNRPVRAMVVGIPNVGKSTFINSYAKKNVAKTGNKPGVTKGKQWIRMGEGLELLDTPGILWPKFEDKAVGLNLAMIGSINDEILPAEELALEMIAFLKTEYPGRLAQRYEIREEAENPYILEEIGKRRGALQKGGIVDAGKSAKIVIDEFRSGILGKLTLEKCIRIDQS